MSCDGCKFWSELIAEAVGGGPLKAMCLNSDSVYSQEMTYQGCTKFELGPSIDDPDREGG